MKAKPSDYTEIKAHLLKYLFVVVPCTECQEKHFVSLDMIYNRMRIHCQNKQCRALFLPSVGDEAYLKEFSLSWHYLGAQLRIAGLPVVFFHDLEKTIWSQDDKQQDNT